MAELQNDEDEGFSFENEVVFVEDADEITLEVRLCIHLVSYISKFMATNIPRVLRFCVPFYVAYSNFVFSLKALTRIQKMQQMRLSLNRRHPWPQRSLPASRSSTKSLSI
jgi:hypothetical protein